MSSDVLTIIAGISAISALIGAVATIVSLFRIKQLHVLINSNLTKMLETTARAGHAEGRLDEQQRIATKVTNGELN